MNEGGGGGERRNLFFCFRSNFSEITRLETLAKQAKPCKYQFLFMKIYLLYILFQNTPKVPHILVIGGGVVGITSTLQLLNKG